MILITAASLWAQPAWLDSLKYPVIANSSPDILLSRAEVQQGNSTENVLMNGWNAYSHEKATEAEKSQALLHMARAWYWRGNYDKASATLEYLIESGDLTPYQIAVAHEYLGRAYKVTTDFSESLEHLLKAKEMMEEHGSTNDVATIHVDLAEYYRATGEYEHGLTEIAQAEKLGETDSLNGEVLTYLLHRKASLKNVLGLKAEAIQISEKALKSGEQDGLLHEQATAHNELGYLYFLESDADKTFGHYQQAINIWRRIGYDRYLANAQMNISRNYLGEERFEEFDREVRDCIGVAKGYDWKGVLMGCYQMLTQRFELTNNIDSAYHYYRAAMAHQIDFERGLNTKEKAEIQLQYEWQQKRAELEEELAEAKDAIASVQQQRNVALVGGVAIALILLIILIISKRRAKTKREAPEAEARHT